MGKKKIHFILIGLYQSIRIYIYHKISTCVNIKGKPIINMPTLMNGCGVITFGNNVIVGVRQSPYFLSNYNYFEVRKKESYINIGDNVSLNNRATIISDGAGISIGAKTLIGTNLTIYDSDFHELAIDKRTTGYPKIACVNIGTNVFIGSNVLILKGVSIGENTIIGSGSVVVKSIPANVIAAGNPCKVIRALC